MDTLAQPFVPVSSPSTQPSSTSSWNALAASPMITDCWAFCHHTPWALLVKPSFTLILHWECGVALQIAAGWAVAMANLPPQPNGHAWGSAATSALAIGCGAEPAKHIHSTGRQRHSAEQSSSAGQSSSSCLLFLSYTPFSLQPSIRKRLPCNFLPQHWKGTKRCARKISDLTSWLYSINARWSGVEKWKESSCLIEK